MFIKFHICPVHLVAASYSTTLQVDKVVTSMADQGWCLYNFYIYVGSPELGCQQGCWEGNGAHRGARNAPGAVGVGVVRQREHKAVAAA